MGIIMETIKKSYNKQTQDLDSSEEIKVDADAKKVKGGRFSRLKKEKRAEAAAKAISEAEAGKKEIEEVVSHKTPVIMTQVKFFDSVTTEALEREVNKFLKTLDSSRIKEISFNSHSRDAYNKYAAMVVYETIE